MNLEETVATIRESFGDQILESTSFRDEETLVAAPGDLVILLTYCFDLGFNCLLDITSVDNMGTEPRFEIIYELYSFHDHIHLRIKARLPEDDPAVDTVSGIWPTADWHEREVYDMMGIDFRGHPDLRRILMWEGYPYHPLRKEFPLAGKSSDVPEVAFTEPAPLDGGPFVTADGAKDVQRREPRSRE